MFPEQLVKASVVDIRKGSARYPRTVVADANVLYFIYYDFTTLTNAGLTLPLHYQRNITPNGGSRQGTGRDTLLIRDKSVRICSTGGTDGTPKSLGDRPAPP